MLKTTLVLLLSMLAPLADAASTTCRHTKTAFRCVQVIKNHDGDTLTVNIPDTPPLIGRGVGVRIRGIDTPEMTGTGPCEKEAAVAAKKLLGELLSKASRVDLEDVGRDKYFRILADVQTDGKSVSAYLIQAKLAYSYDGGTKKKPSWCRVLN